MPNAIILCGAQKSYMHPSGSRYLGEKSEIFKVRIIDYLRNLNLNENKVYLIREIHQANDKFYQKIKTSSNIGTKDIEILEEIKPFVHFIVNTNRFNAFYKTALESELIKLKPSNIFIYGFETHTNVLYTAEELRNRDYDVSTIEPLLVAEDEYMHSAALSFMVNYLAVSLKQE